MDLILELPEAEKAWWKKEIQKYRASKVKPPLFYVDNAIVETKLTEKEIGREPNSSIRKIRSAAWSHYIKDELKFHRDVIYTLIKERPRAGEILEEVLAGNSAVKIEKESIAEIMGEYLGRAMPYFYQLSLSTTNSRRTRAGT